MISDILDGFANILVTLFNYLITGVGIVLGWIVQLFPDSPFSEPSAPPDLVNLGWITWLIPFPDMILDTFYLAGAILTYYSYRVLARWIKLVRS